MTFITISASDTTIILFGSDDRRKGWLYSLDIVSAIDDEMRLAYNELKVPSSNSATGILGRLNVFISSSVFRLLKVTIAGVLNVRALSEVARRMVFLIPSTLIVS